jgi:fermentation-respiration switch protein FrsA (DUF1100 family)
MVGTVTFANGAVEISAHLHLPGGFRGDGKYRALVGIHPAAGVKEQTIGLYAGRLAAHGFVVVVFDASYQGASGGEPRLLEDPTARVEDARCAADFLTTLPYVDVERIAVFGVCAGGGYALAAAQTERRFKAVAGVSATPMGEAARSFFGRPIPAADLIATLEAAGRQRTAEASGADPVYAPFVPEKLEDIDESTPVMLREGYDYYRTARGQHPNSKGRFLMTSLDKMLALLHLSPDSGSADPAPVANRGKSGRHEGLQRTGVRACQRPKELFVIEGATHIALYDVPHFVDQAVAKLVTFFGRLQPQS